MQIVRLASLTLPVLGVASIGIAGPVYGQALVTSPAALNSTDFIDWGQFGPSFTQLTTPQAWTSNLGASGLAGVPGSTFGTTNMERRDEDPGGGGGWAGNFASGQRLLWNQDTTTGDGGLAILFFSPVASAGANINSDALGNFTGHITAYLQGGGTETFNEAGVQTNVEDGSAIFIGVADPTADIVGVEFDTTDSNGNNTVAINTVEFSSQTPGAPEPGPVALFACFCLSGAALIRRRRSK